MAYKVLIGYKKFKHEVRRVVLSPAGGYGALGTVQRLDIATGMRHFSQFFKEYFF
jgi:hypothetical protein